MFHWYTHRQSGRQASDNMHTETLTDKQAETDKLNLHPWTSIKTLFNGPPSYFSHLKTHLCFIIYKGLLSLYLLCGMVWYIPCAGCCGTVLDPYKERIVSLERGFLVESSALLLLFSLNRSRSDWAGAAPAVPAVPEVAPTPGLAMLPAALVELTCTDQRTWKAWWYHVVYRIRRNNFKKHFLLQFEFYTLTITH